MEQGVVDKIRAAGGEVYAISSEPQRLADMAREHWRLNFETIGDPHHEITGTCAQRDWMEIIVNPDTSLQDRMPNKKYSHPKGYFQPGVLALNTDQRVLYRWRGVPTRKNLGGAIVRPTAEYVLEQVRSALRSTSTADAAPDENPKMDGREIPWVLFASILVANGWFVQPRPFPYAKGGPPIQTRVLRAALRLPIFVGLWIAAFVMLPSALVGLALAGWGVWIVPRIRVLNRQFQNVQI